MAPMKKILLVGHCQIDGPMLQDALGDIEGVTIQRINDAQTLQKQATPDALLLVNRVLEGRFESSSGLDLIKSLQDHGAGGTVKAMLISDRAEAQADAEKVGAAKGFGKAKAYDPATISLVRRTMGLTAGAK